MALVQGLNTVASGTGHWTIGIPTGDQIAIDDPGVEGQFPTVAISTALRSSQPTTLQFVGDATTAAPSPADSIGYTAVSNLAITNDTGQTLQGILLTLTNAQVPETLSLVPGVIEFGSNVNANYAYFSNVQPVSGFTESLYSPDGKPTTPTGAAANNIVLAGSLAPGGTVTLASVIHNTELATSANNNFSLSITPITS